MGAVFCFFQIETGAVGYHLALMGDVSLQDSLEAKLLWRLVDDGHHVEIISNLQIGFFEQVSQDTLGIRLFLKLDHDPEAIASALVADFSNTFNLLFQPDILHGGDQSGLDDLERHLGNYNLLLSAAQRLNFRLGA
ncbi:hypothetical protein D3C73_1157350 [compost metagenome]